MGFAAYVVQCIYCRIFYSHAKANRQLQEKHRLRDYWDIKRNVQLFFITNAANEDAARGFYFVCINQLYLYKCQFDATISVHDLTNVTMVSGSWVMARKSWVNKLECVTWTGRYPGPIDP